MDDSSREALARAGEERGSAQAARKRAGGSVRRAAGAGWLLLLAAGTAPGEQPSGPGVPIPHYDITCPAGAVSADACRVDEGTYAGWGFYSRYCQGCHGRDATGSARAPALIDRVSGPTAYDRLFVVVMNGHQGVSGVMPSWLGRRPVMEHIDDLYRYLSARADRALPAGAPRGPED